MHNLKDIQVLSHFQKLLEEYHWKTSDSGNSATDWEIGDIAHHKKWGDGTVLEVTGSGKTQELKIKFPEVGLKKVLASVAPIEKK